MSARMLKYAPSVGYRHSDKPCGTAFLHELLYIWSRAFGHLLTFARKVLRGLVGKPVGHCD